jgi:hypothetical protein
MNHTDRERARSDARTALIEALMACEAGHFDEACLGAGIAFIGLIKLTNRPRVISMVQGMKERAIERERAERGATE